MIMSCPRIRRNLVSLIIFSFPSHAQLFSGGISLVYRLKYPCSCFTSHFCFLVIVILLIFSQPMLFLGRVINCSCLFVYIFDSSYQCIDAILNTDESSSSSSSSSSSFFSGHIKAMSSFLCKARCIVMSSFVL